MSHKPVLTANFPTGAAGSISASNIMWDNSVATSVSQIPTIHTIKGDMVEVEMTIGEQEEFTKVRDQGEFAYEREMKGSLCVALANKLQESKNVSFTKQVDHYNGSIKYRARIYATPDETTRLVQGLLKSNT